MASDSTLLWVAGFGIFGTLMAPVVTGLLTRSNNKKQVKLTDELKFVADERERLNKAYTRIAEALSQSSLLGTDPTGERQHAATRESEVAKQAHVVWLEKHRELVLIVQVAALEVDDPELRTRFGEVVHILRYAADGWSEEGPARHWAISHGLDCVGAAKRAEELPERPAGFTDARDMINDWLDASYNE